MVSFWPWKNDDTSPASFEKALSSLSAKITKTSSKLENLRQRSRRLNVLWILYAGFAYLLCTVILVLVVGWRKWGPVEYTGITVGPGVIYLGRLILSTYYDYRTSTVQAHLDDLERQRNQTIDKLKAATKYNSTQELLKKYGGSPTPKDKPTKTADDSRAPQRQATAPSRGRTNIVPPPTANIPGRRQTFSPQEAPHQKQPQQLPPSPPTWSAPSPPQSPAADFAPNAFTSPPQYAQVNEGPKWYDRLMDVLLGEDESLPGKRTALICHDCRLVNGQAPAGVQNLHDVGKWKCMGCGALNGEEDEVKKIVKSIEVAHQTQNEPAPQAGKAKIRKPWDDEEATSESDVTQYSTDENEDEDEVEIEEPKHKPTTKAEPPRRRSKRVKEKSGETDG